MESMDENIGRLLSWLDQKGLRKYDHLFYLRQRGYKPATDNTPLRGHKGDLYEGGIRVSCIAEGPGVAQGVVSDTPIHEPITTPHCSNWPVLKNPKLHRTA